MPTNVDISKLFEIREYLYGHGTIETGIPQNLLEMHNKIFEFSEMMNKVTLLNKQVYVRLHNNIIITKKRKTAVSILSKVSKNLLEFLSRPWVLFIRKGPIYGRR